MPMRRYRAAVLVALICVPASGRLWAWGCFGHETVALIARMQNCIRASPCQVNCPGYGLF